MFRAEQQLTGSFLRFTDYHNLCNRDQFAFITQIQAGLLSVNKHRYEQEASSNRMCNGYEMIFC